MLKPYEKYIQRVLDGAKELHENGSVMFSPGESQFVHTIPEEPKLEKNELMVDDSEGEDGELGERSSMSPTVVQSVHNYKNRQVHKLRAKRMRANGRSRSPNNPFQDATSRFESSKNVSSYAESAKFSRIEDALSPRL